MSKRDHDNPSTRTLELDNASQIGVPAELVPLVQSVSYDLDKSTLSANCTTTNDTSSEPTACMWGYFTRDNLSFYLNNTVNNAEIRLRPLYKEWSYSDDAPSFSLYRVKPDSDQLGDMVMQTAVTMRNHCETLKICLRLPTPILDIIVPLGLALLAQDRYAAYCTTTRLYS
jgi:hypothetical protein